MSKLIGLVAGVGAANWLLEVLGWNLVELIFRVDVLITVVYILVGLAGIVSIALVLMGDSPVIKKMEKETEEVM